MKKKKQMPLVGNGIQITYNKDSSNNTVERTRIPLFSEFMLVLLQILTGIGGIMTLVTILGIKVNSAAVITTIAISSLVFTCLNKLIKKRSFILLGALLISLLAFYICRTDVLQGLTMSYDQARTTICTYMYLDLPRLDYEWTDEFLKLTTLAVCIIAFFYMSLVSYFTVVKVNFIAIFLLTFPCFEIGAAYGCVPNYYYFSMMLASWSASIALHQANNVKVRTKKRNGKRTSKHVFSSGTVRFAGSSLIIALITVGLFLGGRSLLNSMGFARPEKIETLRQDVKTKADDWYDYVVGEDRDGSLKEGKLLKVDDHNVKDRHYITMETSIVEIDEPFYLKGFNATYYNGNQWMQIENYDSYDKLFEKLEAFSYRIPGINGSLLATTPDSAKYEAARITLNDFRRKKEYAFSMYNSDFDESFTEIKDHSMKPESNSEYSFNAFTNFEDCFDIVNSSIYKSNLFKESWAEYAQFVEAEYVNSEQTPTVESIVAGFQHKNDFALVDEIRNYLSANIKYTFIVDRCPAEVDFVENFLTATRRGYSTHYATAAAVMLQEAGVPARYVEGYCILPEIFNKTETDNKYGYKTIDVTDAYAHAWVEIFDQRFGWIPVEFTPTYYDGSFEDYMNQNIESIELPEEPEPMPPPPEEQPEDNTEDDNGGEDIQYVEEEKEVEKGPWLKILIISASVLAVIIVLFFLVYFVSIYLRNRRLNKGTSNSRVHYAFKYIIKVAKNCGIDVSYTSYSELKEKLINNSKFANKDNISAVFNVVLKSGFAGGEISQQEIEFVISSAKNYAKAAHKSLIWYKKFSFRYIKHLI